NERCFLRPGIQRSGVSRRTAFLGTRSGSSWTTTSSGMPSYTDAVGELPILQFLPDDARERIIASFTPVSYRFGTPIVREGEPADALYVLLAGRARVLKNADRGGVANGEVSLGILKPGDTFGEIGLLEQSTRTVTVRASGDVEALRLDRAVFESLLKEHAEF